MAAVASEFDRGALLSHFDRRTLPDGCIGPTDLAGWRWALKFLRESGWRTEGVPAATADVAALFDLDGEQRTIKVFLGDRPVQVNVFPLEPTSIDFDFATEELVDQEAVDQLARFIRSVAAAANADCELSPEGFGVDVVARYGHHLKRFGVLGDGHGGLDVAVWNHAALGGGDEALGQGDRALSSVLHAHGLISNGGVAHAVLDVMTAPEIEAAVSGFRYLGLHRAASVLETATTLADSDSDEAFDRLDPSYWSAISSDERIESAAALRHATSIDAFMP